MVKRKIARATICLAAPFLFVPSANVLAAENTEVVTIEMSQVFDTITNLLDKRDIKDLIEQYTQENSEYANLAISIAESYVNVRKQPDETSEILGKLYQGCVATIEELDGDWAKISSGSVTGYIHTEYLATDEDEVIELLDEHVTKVATVMTETLKVRNKKSVDSACLELISEGATYDVVNETDEWVKIKYDEQNTGWVSKDYVSIEYEYEYAISIEEEKERIEQEQAEALAAAEALEMAKQQAQVSQNNISSSTNSSISNKKPHSTSSSNTSTNHKKPSSSNSTSSSNSNSSNSSSSSSNSNSTTSSNLGKQIASYAQQFVGNPYVWGGTSLTNGADCSGFVQSVYKKFGYTLPRTSRAQAVTGTKVSTSSMQPGDLLFYAKNGSVNHVAMYIGNGKVVHASNPSDGIKISRYNYRSVYCVRRIVK